MTKQHTFTGQTIHSYIKTTKIYQNRTTEQPKHTSTRQGSTKQPKTLINWTIQLEAKQPK